ncbi:MAG: metallophosphoesterase family protein [Pseudomonadota bacterium]|nr:metallophosphoesterase family protein [Pseudomonadota bacterium]
MLFLLAFAACTSSEPPPADSATPTAAPVVDIVLSELAAPPAELSTVGSSVPFACDEPIYVAQTGWTVDAPVLADPHADTLGAVPAPSQVHVGWSGDPSTSMTMIWRTDSDTYATHLQIGVDDAYGTTLAGSSFLLGTDLLDGRVHEVRVCGLQPGTTWHYRVGAEGAWSPDYTFTTAPPPGSTEPFVFGVAGDSRGSPTTWQSILAGMASHGVEFRLFTGDAVVMGSRVSEWDDWYDAGAGYIESVPTIAANGNHEGLAQPYFALAALPGNEEWFSFDYGNVHFASWNDTVANTNDWATQATWLTEDLAATTQPWKIVFHHKPAYSGCRPNGEDANVRTYFVPVAEAGGVQLDLAGHNHNYERSVPLAGGLEVAQTDGITYVVTAGGGAPLYDNNQGLSYTAVSVETQHYVIGVVEGNRLTMTAYDLGGNVLDTYTLSP